MKYYVRHIKVNSHRWSTENLRKGLHQLKDTRALQTVRFGPKMFCYLTEILNTAKPFVKARQRMRNRGDDVRSAVDILGMYTDWARPLTSGQHVAFQPHVDGLRAGLERLLS